MYYKNLATLLRLSVFRELCCGNSVGNSNYFSTKASFSFSRDEGYNTVTIPKGAAHAVTLIGWDDNIVIDEIDKLDNWCHFMMVLFIL